jgi:hypothetical protein
MSGLRAFIRNHRGLALALLALAFIVRAAIPAGYMADSQAGGGIAISICGDASGGAAKLLIPAKHSGEGDAAKAPCAFAGLSTAMLGGADLLLLALAFAFILILGLAPSARLPYARAFHIRPPLRGPPATA